MPRSRGMRQICTSPPRGGAEAHVVCWGLWASQYRELWDGGTASEFAGLMGAGIFCAFGTVFPDCHVPGTALSTK